MTVPSELEVRETTILKRSEDTKIRRFSAYDPDDRKVDKRIRLEMRRELLQTAI